MRTVERIFANYLKSRRLRVTRQRRLVLESALGRSPYFQADELYLGMRQRGARVSRASVFRTLRLLVEAGLLHEVLDGEKHSHYESGGSGAHHGHMVCDSCGRVIEFETPDIETVRRTVCQPSGFVPDTYRAYILGRCRACASAAGKGGTGARRPQGLG